ncbi:thiamine pyrophosphate-binding protein [Kitasatospora paracochleata]|uniref:Acetolactate synthase-1/2/3 large subunit n=1 Tax=Kitasatospora paracochleata TaxID=58354 RepID=A0ABT1JAM2_9ACTN|nr:thiamine pyrophosphate-binding protein [Kitasatospora paracochleata]MCP2314502.1 acetolactate synthase-1/2/3 large subunit [Kitasatospora paracochleata]
MITDLRTLPPAAEPAHPRRVADQVARFLAEAGVRHVFGVGGANIEDLYDALNEPGTGIRTVVAKHEFSAVTMADGSARTGARLGVVAATSGGGAMNLVPGLAEAYASRVPVLALVGQPPTALEGRGAFQDSSGLAGSLDALALFGPVSRFCARVESPDAVGPLLAEAVRRACSHPRGPAVLLLPKDVQQAAAGALHTAPPLAADGPDSPPVVVERAARLIRSAGRLLVIAGEGVAAVGAKEDLAELVRRTGAWVAVTPDAKDVFDNTDRRFAGVAGVMGHPNVRDCLRRADLCLLVGTRLPVMARAGLEPELASTPLVSADPEPPHPPSTTDLHLSGDLRRTLRRLADRLAPRSLPAPVHAGPVPLATPPGDGTGLSHAEAAAAVADALPPDAHVFVDAGNAGAGMIHRLPAPSRGRFVVAVGMGGMGYTFGAGIGAALATGRRTYVLAGDGSFLMHGMEVHTALEYGAPVTFVILNNNAHAMCATRDVIFRGTPHPGNLFRPANPAAGVAALFPGLDVTAATGAAQLRRALHRTNAPSRGPALVAVDLDPAEIPPFLPFLTSAGPRPTDHQENTHEHATVHVG